MKSATLILPILLPTAYAWTLTWRNSDGEEHTERGTGPSDCITIDHAKGQVFELDGQGEDDINMLLFSNDDCSGDPAGRATKAWTKESSVDLLSFQVVALNGGDDSTTTTATSSPTGSLVLNGTVTSQPTGSSTDPTFTLPTVSETDSETETDATMTNTDSEPTTTETGEPTSTSEGGSETETPTPTPTDDEGPGDAASKLLSRDSLVGVALAAVVGYAANLFL
ncbi:hypothetical protein BJX64DRAFT_295428 [Aspergillus heterothallicus]